MTIFISLLSSALLKYDPQTLADSSNIDILLTLLAALTIALPVLESGYRALRIAPMASTVGNKVLIKLFSPRPKASPHVASARGSHTTPDVP